MGDLRDDLAVLIETIIDAVCDGDVVRYTDYADRALRLVEAAGYRRAKCNCGRHLSPGLCLVCDRDS